MQHKSGMNRPKIRDERRGDTHGLAKPHKCHLCPAAYADERNLRLHLENWHNVRK